MKSLLSIFLVVFFSKGCSQEAQDLASVKIVYGANTRGFHRTIQIENKTFSVTYERNAKPVILPITNAEWNKIAELYAKIDLKNFNNLEGPTMERAYDGKTHADLSISTPEQTYNTKGFDHTIPPAQIKEFVDFINELSEGRVAINPILGSYVVEELATIDVSINEYFISFDANKITGFMGCNLYSGTYEMEGETITVSPLMATKKYCENQMEHEANWFNLAQKVSYFKMENKTILLYDESNKLVLKATKQ